MYIPHSQYYLGLLLVILDIRYVHFILNKENGLKNDILNYSEKIEIYIDCETLNVNNIINSMSTPSSTPPIPPRKTGGFVEPWQTDLCPTDQGTYFIKPTDSCWCNGPTPEDYIPIVKGGPSENMKMCRETFFYRRWWY